MSVLIWIQTILHSDSVSERFFLVVSGLPDTFYSICCLGVATSGKNRLDFYDRSSEITSDQ